MTQKKQQSWLDFKSGKGAKKKVTMLTTLCKAKSQTCVWVSASSDLVCACIPGMSCA